MTGPFDHLLNWRLLKGPHTFPGPDGGTCINEAAVVAAGLDYRRIMTADDLPDCFSPILSMFALGLNDGMDDDERTRLLPFVMRLAGTRDTATIEKERAGLILVQTGRRIFAPLLRASGFEDLGRDLEGVERRQQLRHPTIQTGIAWVAKLHHPQTQTISAARRRHCINAVSGFFHAMRSRREHVTSRCSLAVSHAARADFDTTGQVWDTAIEILDAACRIGRQPDPIAVPLIQARFDAVRDQARNASPEPVA